jgi:hypothetical protein
MCGSDVHHLNGHPLEHVEVVGYVVQRKVKNGFTQYVVDDGSGVIPCIAWYNNKDDSVSYVSAPSASVPVL